jgi:hypothetical protein
MIPNPTLVTPVISTMNLRLLPLVLSLATTLHAAGESPSTVRVFYFGNSLTESSHSEWHSELAKKAGRTWKTEAFMGAGWQSWQHRNELYRALGKPLTTSAESTASKGDLTINAKNAAPPSFKVKKYLENDWDAIVIQIFGSAMNLEADEMWGQNFGQMIEIGDVGAASDIIRHFTEKNPKGQVFIYTVWPNMGPGKVPPDDQLPEWAVKMKEKSGTIRNAEFPDREAFDYEKVWSSPYMGDSRQPWKAADYPHWRTRDYTTKVFDGIKANFPELWKEGRLHHLPGGELFSLLNKKMIAGEFPGMSTIKDYYTDVQHVRAGCPGYTVAALFYAGLFNERPDALDYAIYNDQSKYGTDVNHDFGEVLEITPERAKIINDTVWELLKTHPQAKLR